MEKPIRVRILDAEYLIKSEEPEEHVLDIARFVNSKFKDIISSGGNLSDRKAAILVAFDIASDYFQLLKEREKFRTDIEKRARALNSRIETATRETYSH